jgi:hypothetical protein
MSSRFDVLTREQKQKYERIRSGVVNLKREVRKRKRSQEEEKLVGHECEPDCHVVSIGDDGFICPISWNFHQCGMNRCHSLDTGGNGTVVCSVTGQAFTCVDGPDPFDEDRTRGNREVVFSNNNKKSRTAAVKTEEPLAVVAMATTTTPLQRLLLETYTQTTVDAMSASAARRCIISESLSIGSTDGDCVEQVTGLILEFLYAGSRVTRSTHLPHPAVKAEGLVLLNSIVIPPPKVEVVTAAAAAAAVATVMIRTTMTTTTTTTTVTTTAASAKSQSSNRQQEVNRQLTFPLLTKRYPVHAQLDKKTSKDSFRSESRDFLLRLCGGGTQAAAILLSSKLLDYVTERCQEAWLLVVNSIAYSRQPHSIPFLAVCLVVFHLCQEPVAFKRCSTLDDGRKIVFFECDLDTDCKVELIEAMPDIKTTHVASEKAGIPMKNKTFTYTQAEFKRILKMYETGKCPLPNHIQLALNPHNLARRVVDPKPMPVHRMFMDPTTMSFTRSNVETTKKPKSFASASSSTASPSIRVVSSKQFSSAPSHPNLEKFLSSVSK